MRISDWSSDVCSSDLKDGPGGAGKGGAAGAPPLSYSRGVPIQFVTKTDAAASAGKASMSGNIDLEALCPEKGLRITEKRRINPRVISDYEDPHEEIGRASCKERVRKYVHMLVDDDV